LCYRFVVVVSWKEQQQQYICFDPGHVISAG
jgi:hypothetical protein